MFDFNIVVDYLFVFIFGAVIGSFLNVCVYRIPRGRSIVKPRSYCPECRSPINWYDNIPIISYITLQARCRYCGKRIPVRYFMVELITALMSMALFFYFGLSAQFFVYLIFTYILIVIVFVDIERQEVPDVLSIPGIFLGMILVTAVAVIDRGPVVKVFLNSFLGALAGGGSMFLLGFFGELIFRKESLGGGDVKLMAMIGAFLGWKLVLVTFFLAPVLGLGVALFMKVKRNKEIIPYAPYLSLGAVISLLYGEKILRYLFLID
ncbi:MAG: prepilin peptidase [Candidatus Omnitrophota bacterium]